MAGGFTACLQIFPSGDIARTTAFYESIGFRSVRYLRSEEPHVCLYRDGIEIVVTRSQNGRIEPNRSVHGYGYDAYFITDDQKGILDELKRKGVKVVRELTTTDYANSEFVFEDVDGRWIGVGKKQTAQDTESPR